MLADGLTNALVQGPSLLAAMNARRYVFVTSEANRPEPADGAKRIPPVCWMAAPVP